MWNFVFPSGTFSFYPSANYDYNLDLDLNKKMLKKNMQS